MAARALGRLHNNVAAGESNRRVPAAHGNAELGALVHLNQRAVAQAQHGVSAASRAGAFALHDLIADLECLFATGADSEKHSLERLDAGAHPGGAAEEF